MPPLTIARKAAGVLSVVFTATLALLFPLHAAERWAKLSETIFQHIAQDSGLPNAAIPTAFGVDGDGYLWVGSQNGLARWDGYSFRTYKSAPGAPGALPDNYITTLHLDDRGRLWIGTNSGGLARYERDTDRFTTYSAGPNGLSHVGVLAIADDGFHGIWIATEGGLDHLEPESGTILHVRHDPKDPGSLPDDHVRALLRDRNGTLWIGTPGGLVRSNGSPLHFRVDPLSVAAGKLSGLSGLFEDSRGRIWIGTRRHGVYVVEPGSAIARPIAQTGLTKFQLREQEITAITETRPGEVWIGTKNEGVFAIDTISMQTRLIRHDPQVPDTLPDDSIWAMCRDRAGLIWVSTNRSISLHDPQQETAISTIFGGSSRRDGISDVGVHFVVPMPDGRIWLALTKNGVDILDPSGVRVGDLRPDPATPATALPKSVIDAAAVSKAGTVYLGTKRGLYRTDLSARAVSRVPLLRSNPDAEVWALLLDKNILWVGGPDGLQGLDLAKMGGTPVCFRENDRLTDRRVTVIQRGPPGKLWIGTENGLNRLDLRTHAVEKILPNPVDPKGLLSGFVNSLLVDRMGRLWVGTVGGISVLTSWDVGGRPTFRRLGIADGLPNDNVDALVADKNGNIWASTDDGLAIIDPQTFAIRAFRRADGVVISSYWVTSGVMTPQGELLFGGIGGLTVVRPDQLTSWRYHPPVVVTNVRIGGKLVPSGRFNGAGSTDPLNVAPTANNVQIEFSALDYSAPELCRYGYRLDGYESNWTDTDSAHHLAAYTNLPPGNYTLRVRGSNRDGAWSESVLAIPIHVLPAWYQTAWFRLLELLGLLVLLAALIQARTRQLRGRQRELEQSVAARTAELEDSRRQLEQIAYIDFLTGLPNRRMFTKEFGSLLGRMQQNGGSFALLLIDLDGFKQTNDTSGHDAGDALLIEVAARLRAVARGSDCVARLGGDEFGLLLATDDDASALDLVCRRIFDSFVLPVTYNNGHLNVRLSIGAASFPQQGKTQDELYKSADLALYEVKRTGGNAFRTRVSEAIGPRLTRIPPVTERGLHEHRDIA